MSSRYNSALEIGRELASAASDLSEHDYKTTMLTLKQLRDEVITKKSGNDDTKPTKIIEVKPPVTKKHRKGSIQDLRQLSALNYGNRKRKV